MGRPQPKGVNMTSSNHASSTTLADARLERLERMLVIRKFEERVYQLRMTGKVIGSVHLANGQEAVAVGACAARRSDDPVFATYRGHGWAIACGADLIKLFAELMGRAGGVNGGRGGSAYFSVPEVGFFGENSIVGAGTPIANGAALAARFQRTGRAAISVIGDGAMNQGAVHEAFNMASAMKLPVVFICENNGWAELTPIESTVGQPELYRRAEGYGMPGVRIDGNDPFGVEATVAEALERARKGMGPTLVEAMTQRIVGHYIGDPEAYRDDAERERLQEVEPIAVLRRALHGAGMTEAVAKLEQAVEAEVRAAARSADMLPMADVSKVLEHVRG